jgi:hypothetical protein
LHFEEVYLEIGIWNLANEIATPRQVGARNDNPLEIVKEGIPSRLKIEGVNQG